MTEGDRRRVRIELTEPRPEQDSVAVVAIADYKKERGL
ncbi:phage terminase small subunit [Streptomyces sp. NPDC055008]